MPSPLPPDQAFFAHLNYMIKRREELMAQASYKHPMRDILGAEINLLWDVKSEFTKLFPQPEA